MRHETDRPDLAAPTLLGALRARTAAQHGAAEALLDLDSLADRGRYARVLARFHGFHAAFEAMPVPDDTRRAQARQVIEGRSKVAWLESDLEALGWSRADVRAIPPCDLLAPPVSLAAWIGGLYVTEGATLGGQVVRKALLRMHAVRPVPLAYFTSYGDAVTRNWRAYGAMAETLVTDTRGQDEACAYAAHTFDVVGRWLEGAEPARDAAFAVTRGGA